jgi:hypothetical protein
LDAATKKGLFESVGEAVLAANCLNAVVEKITALEKELENSKKVIE